MPYHDLFDRAVAAQFIAHLYPTVTNDHSWGGARIWKRVQEDIADPVYQLFFAIYQIFFCKALDLEWCAFSLSNSTSLAALPSGVSAKPLGASK